MKSVSCLSLILSLTCLCFSSPSFATGQASPSPVPVGAATGLPQIPPSTVAPHDAELPEPLEEDATPKPKVKKPSASGETSQISKEEIMAQPYVEISFENIARTMWSMNALSIGNDQAVDDFLKITECDLYSRFYLNEFEWKKIREAARGYLTKYKVTFPRHYEYTQPMMLDRYDFALKGFSIAPASVFASATRLELGLNLHYNAKCKDRVLDGMPGYPTSVMMTMKKPFQLSFVRVNEEIAKEYLKMLEEKNVDVTNGRPAYVRFRIRLESYQGIDYFGQATYGNFGGVLETVEVFADREMMFKIYEQALY